MAALTSIDRDTTATASAPQLRNDTRARILEAAFERVAEFGLARLTMDEVARRAGVSRQTVYRYYASKDQLVMALVLREEEKFLDGIREAFARDPDLNRALEDGLLFCLRFAREHPLLDRLLATDPGTLLPYLTIKAGPMIVRAREVMTSLVASKAWVRADVLESVTDAMVRTVISFVMTPPDRPPTHVARDLARILTVALTGKEAKRR
jgi:AcrR family transcriptional regulator